VHINHQFFHREQSHEVKRALPTVGTATFHRLPLLRCEQLREGEVVSARVQVLPAKRQGLGSIAVGEESEVADFDETDGEDVEKETADEFHGLQTHDLEAFAILRIPPPEVDTIVCQAHQSAVGDGHAVGITSQILEHVLGPVQGWLGVDDPLGLAELIEPGMKSSWVSERGQLPVKAELPLGKS
jgi:hypothetical protein